MYLLGIRNKTGALAAVIGDFRNAGAAQRYARSICQNYPVDISFVVMPVRAAIAKHYELCASYYANCVMQDGIRLRGYLRRVLAA